MVERYLHTIEARGSIPLAPTDRLVERPAVLPAGRQDCGKAGSLSRRSPESLGPELGVEGLVEGRRRIRSFRGRTKINNIEVVILLS